MSSIALDAASLDHRPDRFALEALSGVLHQEWIRDAIAVCGHRAERVRQLPVRLTLWVVILLGLFRRHSYVNLLGMLFETGRARRLWAGRGGPPSSSALSKARDRLGVAPLKHLFEKSARQWTAAVEGLYFHGRRVFAVDGSTLRLPDTPSIEALFGRPGSSRGRTSYPQLRLVSLRDAATRICRAVRFGPYGKGEITLAQELLQDVESGSLLLVDRNFPAYEFLWDLHQGGADFVVRLKRHMKFEVVEEIAPGDEIVRVHLPRHLRRTRPDLPVAWLLRHITYRPAGSREEIQLLTTLLLVEEISGDEIASLYPVRWEEETGYDEFKTHLCVTTTITQPTSLRSKTPERIEQELYGLLIAYNALRATMALAATRAQTKHPHPALRVSFIHALERLREATRDMMQAATTRLVERYEHLLDAIARILVPLRPGRHYPRAVKRKMSNYPLKAAARATSSG